MKLDRLILGIAAAAGFTAVAAGAFGAHGLERRFAEAPERLDWWRTGAQYHLAHALALLGVALAAGGGPAPVWRVVAGLFAAGILVFSGSLYLLALTGAKWLGMITPVGGLALLGGWAGLLVAALWKEPVPDGHE